MAPPPQPATAPPRAEDEAEDRSESSSSESELDTSDDELDEAKVSPRRDKRRGRRNVYKAISLPLGGGEIKQTGEVAVFVRSPQTAQRRMRQQRLDSFRGRSQSLLAATAGACAAVSCDIADESADAAKALLAFQAQLAQAEATAASPAPSSSSDGGSGEDARLDEEDLHSGIMSRACEQVQPAQLRLLATKQRLRYNDASSDVVSDRTQANAAASRFTEMYGATVDVLQSNMTLQPPSRRRHSIGVGELPAYRADGGL
mmetsp:Transcript_123237/g.307734  ORF Transcript_123237/g.307734 Transcript_123237/m.307734 type:complete len:259 (+) Transcript_123237:68-844(+)